MKRTAVVVDDERSIAEVVASVLSGSGYRPHIANNGEEALHLSETITPDLLISDVMMPGMSGVELAVEFKKRHPDCKVVLCSGTESADVLQACRSHGYDFKFLAKPFQKADLLRSIRHSD